MLMRKNYETKKGCNARLLCYDASGEKCSRSVPCGVTGLPRYAAITCRSYCVGVRRYHATLLLFPTSLHKSIVPCGGTGLQRYAVPSLLN